jgi:hypothetical protein
MVPAPAGPKVFLLLFLQKKKTFYKIIQAFTLAAR